MWKKIKEQKYLAITTYYILGIVSAVIVFQFTTNSISNNKLDFTSLIDKEILKYIISTLVGGIVGGIVFILMTINKRERQLKEETLWKSLKEKNLLFFIRNGIAFALGGFVYKIIGNILNLTNYDNLFQILFSSENIIDYVGIILGMVFFSIFLSIGIKKRLNLIFGKIEKN